MEEQAKIRFLIRTAYFVTVAVGTPMPLTASQAAQIKDIAANETNYSPDKIKVVEVG